MAIAHDASSDSSGQDGTLVTSLTWSHTCTGSNLVLLVGFVASDGTDADRVIQSITYNGVGMTQAVLNDDTARDLTAGIYYLVAPATGAHNIVITFNGGTVTDCGGVGVSFTGVDQSNPLDATTTA